MDAVVQLSSQDPLHWFLNGFNLQSLERERDMQKISKLKNLIKDKPVHERSVKIRSYRVDDDRLIVEGILRDHQLIPGYRWDGERRPPGVIHRIIVRLLVGGWPLEILDAESEMPKIPHELCPTTLDSVRKIIGVKIASGFNSEIRKRLGGTRGCAHMTYLVTAMGPAAMHGYWTMKSKDPRPIPKSLEEFKGLPSLINSCALWGKDGPIMQHIRDTIERVRKHSRP